MKELLAYAATLIGAWGCAFVMWIAGVVIVIWLIVSVLRLLHVLPPG